MKAWTLATMVRPIEFPHPHILNCFQDDQCTPWIHTTSGPVSRLRGGHSSDSDEGVSLVRGSLHRNLANIQMKNFIARPGHPASSSVKLHLLGHANHRIRVKGRQGQNPIQILSSVSE